MNKTLYFFLSMCLSLCLLNGQAQDLRSSENLPQKMLIHSQGSSQMMELASREVFVKGKKELTKIDDFNLIKSIPDAQLVLYPAGQKPSAHNQRLLTSQILIETTSPEIIQEIQKEFDVKLAALPILIENTYLLLTQQSLDAWLLTPQLREKNGVRSANPLLARQATLKVLPVANPNDPFFSEQWHLLNTGQTSGTPGIDVGVTPVWGEPYGSGFLGEGIRVAILDAGIETTHPDLAANVDTTTDFDYNFSDDDPNPVGGDEGIGHGTSCAGLVAAVGDNNEGVVGVAPKAELVGVRIVAGPSDDNLESMALGHFFNDEKFIDIYSNSWGPSDDGFTKEGPGPLTQAIFEAATTQGRNGRGSIYVWSAGNGKDNGDNSNYDGYTNSIYTISVGAVGHRGRSSTYSESGANLVVVAPSNFNVFNLPFITTTSHSEFLGSFYTTGFNGTSASCPIVAGVVALMLEANPNLGWRDVQEILMTSAQQVSISDSDWIINGGGFLFNHKFGAGLVNAEEAVRQSLTWINLTTQQKITQDAVLQTNAIPDNDAQGLTYTFDLSSEQNLRVEHVELGVNINHPRRGQLTITLTSPDGTESILAETHSDTNPDYDWTFSTVRNWGENSQGQWLVKISDGIADQTGTLEALSINVRGTIPDNDPPELVSLSPSDDSLQVPLNTSLCMRFNEKVRLAGDSIRIQRLFEGGAVEETIAVNSNQVTLNEDSTKVIITLMDSLREETDYFVTVPPGSITDLSGNIFAGITDNITWNFRTVDFTNPEILSFLPQDNSTDVVLNPSFRINFSELVSAGPGQIQLKELPDNLIEQLDTARLTFDNSSVLFTFSTTLEGGSNYFIEIPNDAFKDRSGNFFEGISDSTTWNFSTEGPTSLGEAALNPLRIFPNPITEKILVEPRNAFQGEVNYRLMNPQGLLIQQGTFLSREKGNSFDFLEIPSGLYLLEIEIDGTRWVQKVIKE